MWALPERGGGGVKACQNGLGHFFPTLPEGVRACQDGLEHFFSMVARLTEGGGGGLKLLGNAHIEPKHFEKGLPSPRRGRVATVYPAPD